MNYDSSLGLLHLFNDTVLFAINIEKKSKPFNNILREYGLKPEFDDNINNCIIATYHLDQNIPDQAIVDINLFLTLS